MTKGSLTGYLLPPVLFVGLAASSCLGSAAANSQTANHPVPIQRAPVPTIRGHATVVDGDTIKIAGQRIRLYGIDALEQAQSCSDGWMGGEYATTFMQRLIGTQTIDCLVRETDQYQRPVAVCSNEVGIDLGAAMVVEGLAMADTYSSTTYVAAERQARTAGINIWKPGRRCQPPWRWRKEHPTK